jgi:hypothetical protein
MSLFFFILAPPDERPDDRVNAAWVARRFGCSTRSVQDGKCGTDQLRRVSDRPLLFVRAEVEEHLRRLNRAPERRPPQARRTLVRRRRESQRVEETKL